MTTRRAPRALAALAVALGLTGCTSQVGGQATASSSAAQSTPPGTNSPSTSPFSGLNQCSMLDEALAGQGFPRATPTVARAKESCRTSKATSGDSPGVDVILSLQTGQNYRDNVGNPSQASEGNVNGRPAVEEREPENSSGQCGVWLEVKPNSRALVLVSSGSDTATACAQVEAIAEKVEPLLPKN
ncbi:DUF3558 family protein [Amycolatopsis sp. MtRt-6]|uniref:DUF3558 family protein n=1 Tax=Amycolatopsis sp. MtRt-6 TaxID=2792782 RepID=UPI001A8DB3CA|nr:DUF3558 family protein [Amycolatopsis sp. MtRt-6]